MSDLMLLAVLSMPLADDPQQLSATEWRQFKSRAQQAACRIEADADELAELRAEITRLRAELAETQKLARDDFDLRAEQRDERDRLRAALAAQVLQWLPMGSVPKDGRRVLVAIEGVDRAVVAMWNGGVWETVDGNCWTGRAITHWMPLPAAPGASPQPPQQGREGWGAPNAEVTGPPQAGPVQ